MFKNGAMDMTLSSKFDAAIEDNNVYSAVIGRGGSCDTKEYPDSDAVEARVSAYEKKWLSYIDVPVLSRQIRMFIEGTYATTSLGSRRFFSINYMPDMEEHINVAFGDDLENGKVEEGTYPVLMTQQDMDTYNLVVGEVVSIDKLTDSDGNTLKCTIVGIFEPSDESDIYWKETPADFDKMMFTDKASFDEMIRKYNILTVYYTNSDMLDYAYIDHSNAADIRYYLSAFSKADGNFTQNFSSILAEYQDDATSIMIIIWVLELPIIVLLLAFIYMVSSAATTGAQQDFNEQKQAYFRRINAMNLQNPRLVGFGISNKQTFDAACSHASGAIIGSRFVTLLNKYKGDAQQAITHLKEDL